MTRVQVYFKDKEKFQWGYFNGENLTVSGVTYPPFALARASGMIRTLNKPLLEKLKALGYPATSLERAQARWNKNNSYNITVSITNDEKQALIKYCEERGISMYGLIRDFIRKTISAE